MFLPFKLNIETINSLSDNFNIIESSERQDLTKDALKRILMGDSKGVINGEELQDMWFNTHNNDYSVFISHSHNDESAAIKLASYLENECNLKCFLDTYVWNSADELLLEIDNIYCNDDVKGLFDYKKRNFSTSHVYAMLSMAILDMMYKTECSIFIESDNSEYNIKDIKKQTLSPWLYEEVKFMNKIKPLIPERYRSHILNERGGAKMNYFSKVEDNIMKIKYPLQLKNIQSLDSHDLSLLQRGISGLDMMYKKYYPNIDYLLFSIQEL